MSNKEPIERLLYERDDSERNEAADALKAADKRIAELSRENQAQLDELHAIAEALGTSEGHSSVHHVTELRRKLAGAREALTNIYRQTQEGATHALATEALIAIRQDALAQIGGEDAGT